MTNWLTRWWLRRKNRSLLWRWPNLREFVYLDEVSVTSLLSSKIGKVPSEFTDSITESTKAGLNSSIGASGAVLKANIGSSIESSLTQDSKVVSKATIQATFKQLYESELDHLALKSIHPSKQAPSAAVAARLTEPNFKIDGLDPWVVDPSFLERASLAEVHVELQADPAFRLSTMVSTFAELAADSKELSAQFDQQEFEKVIEINRVLERLMVGLVPLRCLMIDYAAIIVGQQKYLVHRRLLEQLPASKRPKAHDVYLVGVAERSLFWKDIRRILFSNVRFRVLCRLNHDGLATSWTPVKLTQVFGEIAPNLETEMMLFSSGALQSTKNSNIAQQRPVDPGFRAVVRFGELLGDASGVAIDTDRREQIEIAARESAHQMASVSDRRKAFDRMVEIISADSSQEVSKEELSRLRTRACQEAGLLPGTASIQSTPVTSHGASHSDDLFIDAEIIAIYW
jgi:hypothetical protein